MADKPQSNMLACVEAPYLGKLKTGQFEIQHCRACATHFYYPRVLCPSCGSSNVSWVKPSGKGVVYSTTTVRRKAEQGGDYNVSIIELDEGVRMMSRVEGVDLHQIHIGMKVAAQVSVSADVGIVVWRPQVSGGAQS